MKVGSVTESQETFSYKNQRFSEQKFIICVRDERYEFNIKTIISLENNKLIDLDEYEFENNLFATRPPYNKWAGYNSAIQNNDTIRTTPEIAQEYTTNYKKFYPQFNK